MTAITRILQLLIKPESPEVIAAKLAKEIPPDTLKTLGGIIRENGDLSTRGSLDAKVIRVRHGYYEELYEEHKGRISHLTNLKSSENHKSVQTYKNQLDEKNRAMDSLLKFAEKTDLAFLRTLHASDRATYEEGVKALMKGNKYPQELIPILDFLATTLPATALTEQESMIALQMDNAAKVKVNVTASPNRTNDQLFAAIPEDAL